MHDVGARALFDPSHTWGVQEARYWLTWAKANRHNEGCLCRRCPTARRMAGRSFAANLWAAPDKEDEVERFTCERCGSVYQCAKEDPIDCHGCGAVLCGQCVEAELCLECREQEAALNDESEVCGDA